MANVPVPIYAKKIKVKPTRIYRAATGKWEDINWLWYMKNVHYPNFIKELKTILRIKINDKESN